MSKRIFSVLLVAILLLTGCGQQPSTPETSQPLGETQVASETPSGGEQVLEGKLVYWSNWNENENYASWMKEAMESFSKLYPKVTFETVWNGRKNTDIVQTALASGQQIDMFDTNSATGYYTKKEYLIPVTKYFGQVYPTTEGKPYREVILPAFEEMGKLVSKSDDIYAFNYKPSAYMFFYNKDVYENSGIDAPPATWNDFLNNLQKMKDAGYTPIATDDAYAIQIIGAYIAMSQGDEYVKDLVNGVVPWSDSPVVEALEMFEDMVKKGYFKPGQAATAYPEVQQEMAIEGKIGTYFNGTWLPNEVSQSAGEDFRWGQFAFPTIEGSKFGSNYGGYSSIGMFVTKICKNPDLAAAFNVYITTSEFDQKFSNEVNDIPMRSDSTWPKSLTDAKEVISGYDTWYLSGSSIKANSEVTPVINENCIKLLAGTITAEEFIKNMK